MDKDVPTYMPHSFGVDVLLALLTLAQYLGSLEDLGPLELVHLRTDVGRHTVIPGRRVGFVKWLTGDWASVGDGAQSE